MYGIDWKEFKANRQLDQFLDEDIEISEEEEGSTNQPN